MGRLWDNVDWSGLNWLSPRSRTCGETEKARGQEGPDCQAKRREDHWGQDRFGGMWDGLVQ